MKRITSLLVCFAMFGLSVLAQDIQISGKVTSADDGSALPGVSVVVKGTTVGTTTNIDGDYSLSVPANATLVFTFVGMRTQEIVVGGQTTISTTMEMDVTGLEEVVVTAFGISREKKALTYQTATVSGDEATVGGATTAAQGLVGKVAGLQVNVQNNGVNPSSQILLRGMRSPTAPNGALIIIDGAIATQGAFDDLNPNDIESYDILLGATAAALYGADASNGAITITTKKGTKNERFTLGYDNTTTFEEVAFMPDFQSEHGIGWDGAYNPIENTNWGPRFDGQLRQIGPTFADGSFQEVAYAPIQDNLKDFYNTGTTVQNTLYMTGGDEASSFYLSVGNIATKGIIPEDQYERYSVRFNATKKINNIELILTSNYMQDKTSVVGDQIGDQDRNFYWFILNTANNIPLTSYKDWQNPASYGYADNYYNAFYQNPYWAIGTNRNIDETKRLIFKPELKWDITDNIAFTTRAGVDNLTGFGKNWRAYQDYDEVLQPYHSTVASFVEDTEFQQTRYTFDFLFNGRFQLTEAFDLTSTIGYNILSTDIRESFIRADNLSIPGFYDISNGTGSLTSYVDESKKHTMGIFGTFEFGYDKWVYLNLTGRQDWTSTLRYPDMPKGDDSYFYPAIGLNLVLSEGIEAIKNNSIISLLKVTANNSTVYRDLGTYQRNERYFQANNTDNFFRNSGFPYGPINGFYLGGQAVDADIKKEKVNTTEFGLNTAFYGGRITFDGSYFIQSTTDLIVPTTPSEASGATSYLTNIGEIKSTGWEATVGAEVLNLSGFVWDVSFNVYHSENEVVKIKGDQKEIIIESYTAGYGTYAIVGEEFPQIKAIAYERDAQGRVIVDPVSGNPVVGELKNMGQTLPKFIYGATSSMTYKGLQLSASMDYRTGHKYYSQGSDQMEFTGRSLESVMGDRKDFVWPNSVVETSPGVYAPNTNIPISGGVMDFWQNQYNEIKENYVKDASAFKIREVALNYTLPSSLLEDTKVISKVKIGFVARNVLTILPEGQSKFSDPEFRNTRDTDAQNGIGIGGYFDGPPTRSYGFSLNIEF